MRLNAEWTRSRIRATLATAARDRGREHALPERKVDQVVPVHPASVTDATPP
jgi:hypothetical protein